MTYLQSQPPNVNGVRQDLSNSEIEKLKTQLKNIRDTFVPTFEQPVCDTFYLVVEHTRKHGAQTTFIQLNGDTCEYILSLVDSEPEESEVTPIEGE
jgi:hypothetical protein